MATPLKSAHQGWFCEPPTLGRQLRDPRAADPDPLKPHRFHERAKLHALHRELALKWRRIGPERRGGLSADPSLEELERELIETRLVTVEFRAELQIFDEEWFLRWERHRNCDGRTGACAVSAD